MMELLGALAVLVVLCACLCAVAVVFTWLDVVALRAWKEATRFEPPGKREDS